MKRFPALLLSTLILSKLVGCGGQSAELPPPTTAPEMTTEEKANYEKQMEMMKKNRPGQK